MNQTAPKMQEVPFEQARHYLFRELVECHLNGMIFRYLPDAKAWSINIHHIHEGRWFVYA